MLFRRFLKSGLAALLISSKIFLGGCVSLSPEFKIPRKLETRIAQEKTTRNSKADKLAVILSGSKENRFIRDISLAYQIFLENDFSDIYVLDEKGTATPFYRVDGVASKENIEKLLDHLAKKVGREDLLFVYIAGHGGRVNCVVRSSKTGKITRKMKISEIVLPGPDLHEIELEKKLNQIPAGTTIVFVDICHGGGFAKRFSKERYIGISSCEENEEVYGSKDYTFGRYFMKALRNRGEADVNGDGSVSIIEQFWYAKSKNPCTYEFECTPLLMSEKNLDNTSIEKTE